MTPTIPAHRMQLAEVAPRQYGAMYRFSSSVELDHGLRPLIEIRASEINGCAFCLDMHWKDARAAGESEERLYMLKAWRESPLYSVRERAALELCEAMTQIAGRGVPDDVWERATAAFSPEELGQVVYAVAVINTWNRLQITTQAEPGHYHPGMFDTPAPAGNGR
ncbi:MAG TPA: carboxymuconolactone decarboxylase family protein [Solirubrobacteraceae bacterium]|jgi:AhpD family alkylhydroperoxidase|nr:carboxymuconolactone decarboxylase family protein [Solirubrobacteraceae bacterium]